MDWTQVLTALIGSAGLVAVALIGVFGARESRDAKNEAAKVNRELEGNGHGTLVGMVTDIHQDIGAMKAWQEQHELLHTGGMGSGQE